MSDLIANEAAFKLLSGQSLTTAQESELRTSIGVGMSSVDVSNYGPDTTGATSSSQAIQDAIDDLPAEGGTVFFPMGATLLCKNIRLTSGVNIVAYGCKFEFGGSSPSGFVASADNGQGCFFCADGTVGTPLTEVRVEGGEYVGERSANDWSTLGSNDGFQFRWVDGLTVKNITMHDIAQDGIEFKSCSRVRIRDNYIYDISDSAIEGRGGSDVIVEGNHALRVRNLFLYKEHIDAANADAQYSGSEYRILNNYGETFGAGVVLHWPNKSVVSQNRLKAVTVTGEVGSSKVQIQVSAHGDTLDPATLEDILISNNIVSGVVTNTAIQINDPTGASKNIRVEGNILEDGNKGIEFSAAGSVRWNKSDATSSLSIAVSSKGHTLIEGNTAGSITAASSGAHTTKILGNFANAIDVTGTNGLWMIKGNKCSKIKTATGINNAVVEDNDVTCSVAHGVEMDGDGNCVLGNRITRTGSLSAIKMTGDWGKIEGNKISASGGSQPEITTIAGSLYTSIAHNTIRTTATGACIRVYGDKGNIINNFTEGGNQSMRIDGDVWMISNNYCKDSNYQGIQIQATSDKSTMTSNTAESPGGTAFENNGTNTVTDNNRTI